MPAIDPLELKDAFLLSPILSLILSFLTTLHLLPVLKTHFGSERPTPYIASIDQYLDSF